MDSQDLSPSTLMGVEGSDERNGRGGEGEIGGGKGTLRAMRGQGGQGAGRQVSVVLVNQASGESNVRGRRARARGAGCLDVREATRRAWPLERTDGRLTDLILERQEEGRRRFLKAQSRKEEKSRAVPTQMTLPTCQWPYDDGETRKTSVRLQRGNEPRAGRSFSALKGEEKQTVTSESDCQRTRRSPVAKDVDGGDGGRWGGGRRT